MDGVYSSQSRASSVLTKRVGALFVAMVLVGLSHATLASTGEFFAGSKRLNCPPGEDGRPPQNCDPYELYQQHQDVDYTLSAGPNEIKIMTYNVENLFDTEHDVDKSDEEYLPANHPAKVAVCEKLKTPAQQKACLSTNWTMDRLRVKLEKIRQAISVQGAMPDLLAVEEIENANVAKMLAAALGYSKFVITNSPDARGIDVALFFNEDKLTFVGSKETVVLYEQGSPLHKPTRNILTVRFLIPGYPKGKEEYLGVYVNHWPSQMAPSESRYLVGMKLRELIQSDLDTYGRGRYHVVALGDFNTSGTDVPHAHFNTILDPNWKDKMKSCHELVEMTEDKAVKKLLASFPPGTNFYPPTFSWNRFDQIFVGQSLMDGKGAEVMKDSLRVVSHSSLTRSFQETKNATGQMFASVVFGVPWRFDHGFKAAADAGFSDHFPVVAKIQLR